ncbi:hypothetical protein CRYUN_Cryun09bG0042100 [Craigia yunnanensis]
MKFQEWESLAKNQECDMSRAGNQDIVILTSLALRLVVVLTDLKSWKIVSDDSIGDADSAVKNLVLWEVVEVASIAITLAIRPLSVTTSNVTGPSEFDVHSAAELYCLYLLTIPWLTKHLPAVLLSALKHKSTLSPCLQILLISRDKIVRKKLDIDQSSMDCSSKVIPPVGWALANIMGLVAESENDFLDFGALNQGLEYVSYVHVVTILADNLLAWLHNAGWSEKGNQNLEGSDGAYELPVSMRENRTACGSLKTSFMDLFRPVCQQWQLKKLLEISKRYAHADEAKILPPNNLKCLGNLELLDIAYFYSHMLRIFAAFNPMIGPLPVLNMLSFTPGFLGNLWGVLESSIFHGNSYIIGDTYHGTSKVSGKKKEGVGVDFADSADDHQVDENYLDVWDLEPLRHGPQGSIHTGATVKNCISVYTLVYNGLSCSVEQQNGSLMDSAIRCLHLMYERDCRHQFCPPGLWFSPAKRSGLPIAVAARTHEVLSANIRSEDAIAVYNRGSVITCMPHVFPFEERVEMFREFINMDKVSRKMAVEVAGPGSRSVEIVIRREAGLDYGGLSKEFLTDISKAAFAPEYGLFSQTSTSDRFLIPNAAARYLENGIQMIEFLGRVVGKALYEGILLDYSFSHVFVQKLLGRYSFLDELSTLDPELYRNLIYVKILPFSNAFYRGLTDLISPSWLKLFNASDLIRYSLKMCFCGVIVMKDFEPKERCMLLKFVTSCSRAPLPGFKYLLPSFTIHKVASDAPLWATVGGPDVERLPSASTCYNTLKEGELRIELITSVFPCSIGWLQLPTYKRSSTLKAKLRYAISSNAGFELS